MTSLRRVTVPQTRISHHGGTHAEYAICVNGNNNSDVYCWRRFAEFYLFAQKLHGYAALQAKLPGKLPAWSNSSAPQVVRGRQARLEVFLAAALNELVSSSSTSSSDAAPPPHWAAAFYNFCNFHPTSPTTNEGDSDQVAALRITQLERTIQELQAEVLQAQQERVAELERSAVFQEERVEHVLEEKKLVELALQQETALRLQVEHNRHELEHSLVEEHSRLEDEAAMVQQLKKQRGLLELEIARLENSQKSASTYGSTMSAKLGQAEAKSAQQQSKHQEELQRVKQQHQEELQRVKQQHQAEIKEMETKLQDMQSELEEAEAIKLKLVHRVDELLKQQNQ